MTNVVTCDPAVDQSGRLDRATQRAHALADRLEQGARALAALASALTDAEWETRYPQRRPQRRRRRPPRRQRVSGRDPAGADARGRTSR